MEWHGHDVAAGLMEAGHRVSVITTPLPKRPALARLRPNGELITIGERPGAYDRRFFWEMMRPAMFDRIEALRPDVIHCQGFAGIPAWRGLARRFPVVTTIHGTLWSETALRRGGVMPPGRAERLRLHWKLKHRHLFEPIWKAFLKRKPQRRPPFLVVDSRFSLHELAREAHWERGNHPPVAVIPLGFDLGRFPLLGREQAARLWEKPAGRCWMVASGRLEPIKGFDRLLSAFLEICDDFPHWDLVIAGRGTQWVPLRKHRRALPPELRARIHLPGYVPAAVGTGRRRHLPSLLEAADLFLNADQGAPAFGLANAEALAMGTPVLATNAGAHGEVLCGVEDGWMIRGDDEAQWASQLRRTLATLPEEAAAREQRAQRARARFSRAVMVRRLLGAYRRACARYGTSPPE